MFSEDLREMWAEQHKIRLAEERKRESFKTKVAKEKSMSGTDKIRELEAKLQELEAAKNAKEVQEIKSAPKELKLDGNDKIRLENILLKESIMERDKKDARTSFYSFIMNKYHIDTSKYGITVNADKGIITLQPLS